MKFRAAIDLYLADMRAQGRINSDRTEVSYRHALKRLAEIVENRDPTLVGRDEIKRTLATWKNPNTQRTTRSILVSFFDWMVEEGMRPYNPAAQTRRPRRRPTQVYRLTLDEARRFLEACRTTRERRLGYLGVCAGLRSAELRGLQGRHFERPGWIWVSADIAKGGRERWVPVIPELAPVVEEIRSDVGPDEFVLPAQRFRDPGVNRERTDKRRHPASAQAVYYAVRNIGRAAGIVAPLHPHLMRHAFADHVARHGGIRIAQHALGHASVGTTESYLSKPSLDEIQAALRGFGYGTPGYPAARTPAIPLKATTGIEPVSTADGVVEPDVDGDEPDLALLLAWAAPAERVELYAHHFGGTG